VIKERKSQRPEARAAARQQAIAAGKAKKTDAESTKKAEKAKGAAKAAGATASKVSKQQAKGAQMKVQAKSR
jgi:large subunit ribosomal protein L24e